MKTTKQYKNDVLLRFRKWLEEWMTRKGYSQQQAAIKLGVTATTINRILKGSRGASDELITKMINNSGENLRIFQEEYSPTEAEITIESNRDKLKLVDKDSDYRLSSDEMAERGFIAIPFSQEMRLAAGGGGTIPVTDDEDSSPIIVHGPSLGRRNAKNLQAFRVGGDSMEPLIAKGGIILADLSQNNIMNIHDSKVYVLCWDRDDGECAVKYLRWFEKGKILSIESENLFYKPVLKKVEDIVLIGKAIWAWRDLP